MQAECDLSLNLTLPQPSTHQLVEHNSGQTYVPSGAIREVASKGYDKAQGVLLPRLRIPRQNSITDQVLSDQVPRQECITDQVPRLMGISSEPWGDLQGGGGSPTSPVRSSRLVEQGGPIEGERLIKIVDQASGEK